MATLQDVEKFIEEHPDDCFAGEPASDELIEKAERFLDVRFHEDYKAFLKRWGSLSIGPIEFYGLVDDDFQSPEPATTWLTSLARRDDGLPKELIVLYYENGARYFCLDTSIVDESRVVVWDCPYREVAGIRAHSLFDFILEEPEGSF